MKKWKLAIILVVICMLFSCVSKKHRYDRCPTFGLKAKKTESVNARI